MTVRLSLVADNECRPLCIMSWSHRRVGGQSHLDTGVVSVYTEDLQVFYRQTNLSSVWKLRQCYLLNQESVKPSVYKHRFRCPAHPLLSPETPTHSLTIVEDYTAESTP